MADRLKVTDLDFDTIKNNLKAFLNQQSEFTDYDFEGSGLNILLDILAYNTHYQAYYLNMVANEAFLDTALLRDSVVSHAKTLGYTPYSKTAPVAIIDLEVKSSSNNSATVTIPSAFPFLSNQIDGKSYNFVVLEPVTATKANTSYYFENLQIYEGQLATYTFNYDKATNPKQLFVLPDANIDIDTIKVIIRPNSSSTETTVYNRVTEILDIDATSEVFFLQEGRGGQYQIYFGNDVVGKSLADGSVVSVTYLITNGNLANKANNFVAAASLTDTLSESLTNFVITPISAASGGSDRETVDEIKFSASAQYTTQNRLVTLKDYESFIKKEYPSIDSVSIWGGEDEDPKVYGKVFISLKPKTGYYLSETEKQRIIDEIIAPKLIVSVSAEIRDPEYVYLLLDIESRYDSKKTILTEEQIKQAIKNSVLLYRNTYLNKFSSQLIDSKLEKAIDDSDTSIIGNELTVRAQKRFTPSLGQTSSYLLKYNVPLNRGTYTNKLKSTEFSVYDGANVLRNVIIEEIPQSFTGISKISVTNPGYGYTSVPTVTITGDGAGAEAEAVVVNGKIQSINITKRGIDYSRAIASITGGGGQDATAVVDVDYKVGTLRTVYFDSNAERKIVDSDVGSVNYETGLVQLNDIKIESVSSSDGQIRVDVEVDAAIIESVKNTIITIDDTDPSSILVTTDKI